MEQENLTEKEIWRRYHIKEALARKNLEKIGLRGYLQRKNEAWEEKAKRLAQLPPPSKEGGFR